MKIERDDWKPLGETVNTKYYEVEPNVIAAVPVEGSRDDLKSAQENRRFQRGHWEKVGHGGVVLVFVDRLVSQDKDARRVYQDSNPELMRGTALIGGSMLARAIGSFFLGLVKPTIPVKMFGTFEEALVWAHALNAAADDSSQETT